MRTTVHVTQTRTWPDGGPPPYTVQHSHVWEGYTAEQALTARLRSLRWARARVARGALTLTVHRDQGDHTLTEVLVFEERP